MRRIFDAVHDLTRHWDACSTVGALGEDLRWWQDILMRWDGLRIIHRSQKRVEIWTDAATTKGIGAHFGPREACTSAFSRPVPDKHHGKDILFLETLALLDALREWKQALRDKEVVCKIDNAALVACVRSARCDQKAIQTLIRYIFALAMELHLTLIPDWVPSAENDVADALSRFDWPYLQRTRPHVIQLAHNPPPTLSLAHHSRNIRALRNPPLPPMSSHTYTIPFQNERSIPPTSSILVRGGGRGPDSGHVPLVRSVGEHPPITRRCDQKLCRVLEAGLLARLGG